MSYIEKHMRESLKDHKLELVLDAPRFRAFYLKRPGEGRMMSTLIVFTPEGIVVCGDLCPGHGDGASRGVISTLGYGEGWFSGKLSEDYLCEKFLNSMVWELERAQKEVRDNIEQATKELREERKSRDNDFARDALARLRRWKAVEETRFETVEQLIDALYDNGFDTSDGPPGYGYPSADAGWLCAIQQKFAEDYSRISFTSEKSKA